ncbi:MAG: cobalamin-binding protein [Xanthomonadales bacterium]|nr:cobalamin-binding protein [Xanthomonadales bacterium]
MTEETTETLYMLGEQDRIVGISGFTVRPPEARREKPRVSAFTSAKIDRILELKPDLVLGFSDLQADIAAELIRKGVEVHVFNHRSVEEILNMMVQLAALVGRADDMMDWVAGWEKQAAAARIALPPEADRPRVYFEEWDDPLISGIRWVSELIELAGGIDTFPENAREPLGKNRIIADPLEVARREPDIIIGSWCGKKFRPEKVADREGWQDVPAVRDGQIFEIKSALILQPGPAALTDGLEELQRIISSWHEGQGPK